MEPMVRLREIPAIPPIRKPVLEGRCAHGRMIDEVRTRGENGPGRSAVWSAKLSLTIPIRAHRARSESCCVRVASCRESCTKTTGHDHDRGLKVPVNFRRLCVRLNA